MLGNRVTTNIMMCPECGCTEDLYYCMGDFACKKCNSIVRCPRTNKENLNTKHMGKYLTQELMLDKKIEKVMVTIIDKYLSDICERDQKIIDKYIKENDNETNN